MNVIREEIFGVDLTIQSVQTDLYNYLSSVWQGELFAYGRAYKNKGPQMEIKPEIYVGKGEYSDVLLDDRKDASFFFLQGDDDQTEDEVLFTSRTKIIFMVNLSKIFKGSVERNDARAESDVIKGLREYEFGRYSISKVERGLENVFRGVSMDSIKFSNIHPFYCFSIEIELEYYTTDNCY